MEHRRDLLLQHRKQYDEKIADFKQSLRENRSTAVSAFPKHTEVRRNSCIEQETIELPPIDSFHLDSMKDNTPAHGRIQTVEAKHDGELSIKLAEKALDRLSERSSSTDQSFPEDHTANYPQRNACSPLVTLPTISVQAKNPSRIPRISRVLHPATSPSPYLLTVERTNPHLSRSLSYCAHSPLPGMGFRTTRRNDDAKFARYQVVTPGRDVHTPHSLIDRTSRLLGGSQRRNDGILLRQGIRPVSLPPMMRTLRKGLIAPPTSQFVADPSFAREQDILEELAALDRKLSNLTACQ